MQSKTIGKPEIMQQYPIYSAYVHVDGVGELMEHLLTMQKQK
jgi:hypothetical protein